MKPPATIRALLIEDSLGDALMVMQRLARGSGSRVEVERATTLQQGLDLLGKGRTDVVLLDLHLPDSCRSRDRAARARGLPAPADRGVLERRAKRCRARGRPVASPPVCICSEARKPGHHAIELATELRD